MKPRFLLFLAAVFSACAPHAMRERAISTCRDSRCEPVIDATSRERMTESFHELLKKSNGGQIALFAAKPGGAPGERGLHFFTQGGPIPGVRFPKSRRKNMLLSLESRLC